MNLNSFEECIGDLMGNPCASCRRTLHRANFGGVGVWVPDRPEEVVDAVPQAGAIRIIVYGLCKKCESMGLKATMDHVEASGIGHVVDVVREAGE